MALRRDRAEIESSGTSLSDLEFEGMVHVATLRSPVSRGSVKEISTRKLPKEYRLILPNDIPGANRILSFGAEIPLLASASISYRGEPIGLVAGPDPVLAAEIAAEATIVCDEEDPRFSWESFSSDQVRAKRVAVMGDPDLAFSIAATVIEDTFSSGCLEHFYSEAQGALALFDYDKMAIYCATQWPYHVRESAALVLGCKSEEVVVRPTPLGVHLDGKLWYPSFLACHAVLAARACKKPAKILLTREEDFRYTPKRARSSVALRAATDPAGRLSAVDLRIALNVGAIGPLAEEILTQTCIAASGTYDCANIRVEGYAVETNTLPLGAFAGLGASHSFFALETASSRLAETLGEDPMDWKAKNILKKGSRLITGEILHEEPPYAEISERLCHASDWRRKYACYELVRKRRSGRADGPLRGIGFAFAYQGAGAPLSGETPSGYSVEVVLDMELSCTIKTSAAASCGSTRRKGAGRVESRDGLADIWRGTAADILGIEIGSVCIAPPDTDSTPDSGPAVLSRGISVINRLIERACNAIQKRRFRDPLPLSSKSIYRQPKPIRWEDGSVAGSPFGSAAWGGTIVELELDPWTFEPKPLGIWICAEGGTIASVARAESALRRAAVDALGSCLRESLDFEDGEIGVHSYFEYGILGSQGLPPLFIDLLVGKRKASPKGIGELPYDTVPAAFLSALSQATGSAFSSLPLSSERLFKAMEET